MKSSWWKREISRRAGGEKEGVSSNLRSNTSKSLPYNNSRNLEVIGRMSYHISKQVIKEQNI